jgi:hypothetical protein
VILKSLTYFFVPLLVRRAKLGFVYGVQVPILEALAKHQVLSVASASATRSAKRTQGGDGPQCESVKGFSPDMNKTVDADAFSIAEGNIKAVNSHDCRESTGVVDRGTSLWQSRELGRSHEFFQQEVGWHNWSTGRKPNDSWEVGCPYISDEVG